MKGKKAASKKGGNGKKKVVVEKEKETDEFAEGEEGMDVDEEGKQ